MIILDTNVVSEIMKSEPKQAVASWLDSQSLKSLYITTISVMELRYGVELLPEGKRKNALWEVLDFTIYRLFDDRILNFDRKAAEKAAEVSAKAKARGMNLGTADMQIAGLAIASGMSIASRDEMPFIETGVHLINPWISTKL